MWAIQLAEEGTLVISHEGITDNWRFYYPNTVPKPLEMLTGFLRLWRNHGYHSILVLAGSILVLAAAYHAAGGGRTGAETAVYLGLNPVFIFLAVRGNPAIPFMGAAFLLQTVKGNGIGTALAALSRPEGFIYGGWNCIKRRNWKLLLILAGAGAAWLVFHKLCCNTFFWTSKVVKYSVAAMAYPTPNPVTFLPWAAMRSVLILGVPAAAIFYTSIRKWQLAVPFALNFAMLTLSLALGSLVLPRYIDQIFLFAAPFIFMESARLFRGKKRMLVTCAMILFPLFQWISIVPELKQYADLRSFYTTAQLPDSGVTAVNELLVPGLALENGMNDPRGAFVATDKAAYENATGEELMDHGVTCILVYDHELYYPAHTESWLETIEDIEVTHFPGN